MLFLILYLFYPVLAHHFVVNRSCKPSSATAFCTASEGLWTESISLWPSVLHDQLNQIPTSKSLTVVARMTARTSFRMYAMPTTFQSSGKVAAVCDKGSQQLSYVMNEHLLKGAKG